MEITDPVEALSMTLLSREEALQDLAIVYIADTLSPEDLQAADRSRFDQLLADEVIRFREGQIVAGRQWAAWFEQGPIRVIKPGAEFLEIVEGTGIASTERFARLADRLYQGLEP